MVRTLCTIALVAVLAGPALAGSPSVGQAAPDFGQLTWAVNEPDVYQPSELRGEAIFVEVWGMR